MIVLLRGGGDLASGVAARLYRVGIKLVITELPQPVAVRRLVSFSEAIYRGMVIIEEITARRTEGIAEIDSILAERCIPILVDPHLECRRFLKPEVIVDARMAKSSPDTGREAARLVIGLGPGFVAGANCHAAVETNRGHFMGRVFWKGSPTADTGIPEGNPARVLRAPKDGVMRTYVDLCDHVQPGQPVAEISGEIVTAPFRGVLRGILNPGMVVRKGMKIGDVDPRDDPSFCAHISDKSLAVGGGALEAILSCIDLRPLLWE